jgi:aminocarboxymuconate-semialdehyde decarboxylase
VPNRREFFKTVAAATAGAYVAGRGRELRAQAPPARRQVTIGGRRVRVVDVHAHWDMPLGDVVKGTPYEKDRASGPGLDDRLAVMDKLGIDVAALTVNDFWWWEIKDQGLARAICNKHNETLAQWSRQHPDRFVGMASVPLQFPELAADMLQDVVKRLGARGVTVGGHVNGESLTLPKYDVFWAKAAELGELVFMHPNGSANIIQQGALAGRGGLGNIVGNPLETTVFLSRLIFDGTFDKFPALRVCGSHGGGYLPSYLGRTEVACQRTGQNCIIKKRPSDYMRSQILADSMVFSPEGLRHLVAEMGVSQVVFGTDTPFNWPVTVDLIVNAGFLSNAEKEAILGGNLMKLLRITT